MPTTNARGDNFRSLYHHKADEFIEHLKSCGCKKTAIAAVGATNTALVSWTRNHPELQERINDALSQYRETQPLVLVNAAKQALANYVFGRMEKVSSSVTTQVDANGNFLGAFETITRTPVGVPKWAIDRVLGTDMSVVDALKMFADSGFLPQHLVDRILSKISLSQEDIRNIFTEHFPDQDVFSEVKKKPGLSDFGSEIIRARILKVPESETFSDSVEVVSVPLV